MDSKLSGGVWDKKFINGINAIMPKKVPPLVDFDRKAKLKSAERKNLKVTLFPKIGGLVHSSETKDAVLRFASLFIANLVRAYETNPRKPHGIEFSIKGDHQHIQPKRQPEFKNFVIETVVKFIVEETYATKFKAEKKPFLMKNGNIGYAVERSTVFIATNALIEIVSGNLDSKTCRTCGIEKPVEDFGKQRNGYESECKSCRAIRKKTARQNKRLVA